jgi:predicted tellurium resistance membrane protein TerC
MMVGIGAVGYLLRKAVGTIAMADAVMSLDNVVAIAAIARDDYSLFVFGLLLSIPLIVVGASLISGIIAKFPIFVWAGAALLGWISVSMVDCFFALQPSLK